MTRSSSPSRRDATPEVGIETRRDTADELEERGVPAPLGGMVGRYVIVERVGEGGMGTVLRAYDSRMQRNVALKLLRYHGDDDARTRMSVEAQSMAQLAHPNIVTAYDVDEHEGIPFIAMEFVEGVDLRKWLEKPRPWRAIVRTLVAAGRGLAAAHAAGIVHRDFKPDNVLVGVDGRARVTDFGLARGVGPNRPSSGRFPSVDSDLTQEGTVMGTLGYMAPEQQMGKGVDARSDQYAFCVTLWEALHGQRPFVGQALLVAKLDLKVSSSDPSRRVPRFLRPILLKGMAPKPEDRFASMGLLLDALERRPYRRAVLLAAGIGGLAAVGGGAAHDQYRRADDREACEEEARSIEPVWGEETRARVELAFSETGVVHAGETFVKLVPWLDRFAAEWSEQTLAVCLAERGLAGGDPHLGSRPCLAERRAHLAALVDVLRNADTRTVTRSVTVAAMLPRPASCGDAAHLARMRPGAVPQDAARVEEALGKARAAVGMGQYTEANAAAQEATALAEASEDPRLVAKARFMVGHIAQENGKYDEAEAHFEAVFATASDAGADDIALEVATMLAYLTGDLEARHDAGLVWGQVARATVGRIDADDDPAAASLANTVGGIYHNAARYDEALAAYGKSLALGTRLLGAEHPFIAKVQTNIATALADLGRYDESLPMFAASIRTYEAALGSGHPTLATTLNNLGNAYQGAGQYKDAIAAYQRAIELLEGTEGNELHLAPPLYNWANVLTATGRLEEAEKLYTRVLAIWENSLGPEHPNVATGLSSMAKVHDDRGEHEAAVALEERALAVRKAALGPEHQDVATSLNNLGVRYGRMGQIDRATTMCEQARDIWARTLGPAHSNRGLAILNLGRFARVRGRLDEATATTEEGLALMLAAHEGDHEHTALAYQYLADVRYDRGERDGARKAYETAQEMLKRIDYAPEGSRWTSLWYGLGRVHFDAGEVAEAGELFGKARGAASHLAENDPIRADLDFALAKVSWAQGQPDRARNLATAALTLLEASPYTGYTPRADIAAWLRAHR